MALSDRALDLLHFLLTVLFSVLLNSDLLLFTDGSSPVINILKLLLLLALEGLLFLLEDSLIEAHDLVVVDLTALLHFGNLNLADLLDTSACKFGEDFLSTDLSHQLELFKQLVLLALLLFLDLLDSKLLLAFLLLGKEYVLESASLLSMSACDLFLHALHVILALEDFRHFLLHLFLHLHKDALTLLALGCSLLDFQECIIKLEAEADKVVLDFDLLVECDRLSFMADYGLDEAFAVAFVEEHFH